MITRTEYDLILRALDEDVSPVDRERLDDLLGHSAFDEGFVDLTMKRIASPKPRLHFLPSAVGMRRLAVAAVVLVALGIATFRLWTPGLEQIETRTVLLSDGSLVVLSPGSEMTHSDSAPSNLASARIVNLRGEAFFDVAHDGSPFVVRLAEGDVVVTGTRFNVRSWPGEVDYAEVTLVDGSVRIETADAEPTTLAPGQSVRFRNDQITTPMSADTSRALAWISGGFGFHEVTVDFAFREIGRRYGVHISFADAVDQTRRITYLSSRSGTLPDVMSDLCHALNLQYRSTRSGYEIGESQ